MTRIGLFIIPLAGEREREREQERGTRLTKRNVLLQDLLAICQLGPMVGSQCMLIISMGIKGASSLEISPLKPQALTPYKERNTHLIQR